MKAIAPIFGFEAREISPLLTFRLNSIIQNMGIEPCFVDEKNILRLFESQPTNTLIPFILEAIDNPQSVSSTNDLIIPLKRKYPSTAVISDRLGDLPNRLLNLQKELSLWDIGFSSEIRNAIRSIYIHLSDIDLTVSKISREASVSLDRLERQFHIQMGMGIWHYVIEIRMNVAKHLIGYNACTLR